MKHDELASYMQIYKLCLSFMLSFIEILWMIKEEMNLQGMWTDRCIDRQTVILVGKNKVFPLTFTSGTA